MTKKSLLKKVKRNMFVVLGIPLVIWILIYISNSGIITNVDIDYMVDNIILLLPPLIGMFFSLYGLIYYKNKKDIMIITHTIIGTLLGIFTSYFFYILYDNAIWLDDVITATFTLEDLQLITIIWCLIMGFLSGVMKSR